jgi:L-rhamnose 1-dehydrogenase
MQALLAGKSAVVTGGVTGIGRAIALGFLRQGASVTVNHLDDTASRQHLESLQNEAPKGSRIHSVAGDIGGREVGRAIVEGASQKFGGVDVFVANAGVSQFRDFLTYVVDISGVECRKS